MTWPHTHEFRIESHLARGATMVCQTPNCCAEAVVLPADETYRR